MSAQWQAAGNEVVLVTGASGYIGSHTCVALLQAGYRVIGIDDLSNSNPRAIERLQAVAGRPMEFVRMDVREHERLTELLKARRVSAVIHFAGLKAVAESVRNPLEYYDVNVGGTLALLRAMRSSGVRRLVFSSSATVYGQPDQVPVGENAPLKPFNPYGHSKAMVEQVLRDHAAAEPGCCLVVLRYFNPAGAHPSGELGEDPRGVPNNLMPYVLQVAVGRRPELQVFGSDYPTPDGTGVRDYIHVVDLAAGHLAALAESRRRAGFLACNLGAGQGHSVLELVAGVRVASGQEVRVNFAPRRDGDIAETFADITRAREVLGWAPVHSLADICADAWRWQRSHPFGYETRETQAQGTQAIHD